MNEEKEETIVNVDFTIRGSISVVINTSTNATDAEISEEAINIVESMDAWDMYESPFVLDWDGTAEADYAEIV
jgi:hypothetical protein